MPEPFYLTTAIAYVNGPPHLGHAYEVISTDVIARHFRQRDRDVFFLTGTDEHGEPVADSAHANGLTPQDWADQNAARFVALMPQLNISNDFFIRTTDDHHKLRVRQVLQRVYDNGHVYKDIYEGWYCPRCADFKVENEILDGNRCPIHEIQLVREQEENWFFRLSSFQAQLEELFASQPDFVQPPRAMNEAAAFLGGGLQDVSLSRGKLTWGVQVPWDPTHVFYVWFEALLNYYTALGFARPGEDLTDHYWPADLHVIGKDILKFHAIYWPALLLAAGIELPKTMFVHGFLLAADGRKMSKSLGNVLDPFEAIESFGVDALRFYLMRDVTFGQDGAVGIDGLETRYTTELANEYGNLASRTLAMISRYCDGSVPTVETDPVLRAEFDGLTEAVSAHFDRFDTSAALAEIWERVRRLNRYVEERAPWQLAKDPADAAKLHQVLGSLYEGLRVVSVLLHPYIPVSTEQLTKGLGAPELMLSDANFAKESGAQQSGDFKVARLPPMFPKRD